VPPTLGCGSMVHGINFDFDSATIRPDSEPVLAKLFDGLKADKERVSRDRGAHVE
jgi:outer membrane protein OmpA-like peptidoglycan-associated protein